MKSLVLNSLDTLYFQTLFMLFSAFQASALHVLMSCSEEVIHKPKYLKSSTSSSAITPLLRIGSGATLQVITFVFFSVRSSPTRLPSFLNLDSSLCARSTFQMYKCNIICEDQVCDDLFGVLLYRLEVKHKSELGLPS